MINTKEQERKALAQIRKIVEDLGEGSYIGMAFEGCFEIAEENIENDFGCSMKQRAESAEKKVASLELDNRDLRNVIKQVKQDCANAESSILNTEEINSIIGILSQVRIESAEIAGKAAQRIVELAETPGSEEFREAVRDNRDGKKRMETCEKLVRRLAELHR